jgi:hypothetical protein
MNQLWLPEGHHYDLHIVKGPRGTGAGAFTGGGWKLLWHTTESDWYWADAGATYLVRAKKEPHFIIGGRRGLDHPVVVQMLPLNEAGRALGNDNGDHYETNRANVIQVEIAAKAENMGDFDHYRALANLAALIMHRVPIKNVANHSFRTPVRMSDAGFVRARGHVGHVHAPDNDHGDPGRGFKVFTLKTLIDHVPEDGYAL